MIAVGCRPSARNSPAMISTSAACAASVSLPWGRGQQGRQWLGAHADLPVQRYPVNRLGVLVEEERHRHREEVRQPAQHPQGGFAPFAAEQLLQIHRCEAAAHRGDAALNLRAAAGPRVRRVHGGKQIGQALVDRAGTAGVGGPRC